MRDEQIVQFVCFETTLDTAEFIAKWEQFSGSVNRNTDIHRHASKKNGLFRYVVQQRCLPGEFRFILERKRGPSMATEVTIKAEQVGGYSILQLNRSQKTKADESKVFAFLPNPVADPELYRKMNIPGSFNIYEPYYENCRYESILEFFVKDNLAEKLLYELKEYAHGAEVGIFKECLLQLT